MRNNTRPRTRSRTRIGDTFELGNPTWGRAVMTVVQRTADGTTILYRSNIGIKDERNRWYVMGGPGRTGLRLLEDE